MTMSPFALDDRLYTLSVILKHRFRRARNPRHLSMASRTPSPDYGHPAFCFTPPTQSEEAIWPCCCCIVFVQHRPAARNGLHPRLLWQTTCPGRPEPGRGLQTEIDSFVGWLLELLPLPFERSGQLRRQLRNWQMELRGRCSSMRLRWYEAYAIYALELCV